MLTESDLGGRVRVEVSFTDGHSYEETLFSDRTRPLNAPATGSPLVVKTSRVLSATLTADRISSGVGYGVDNGGNSSLNPSTFAVDGTTYTVVRLEAEHGGPLSFALDRELASDFELTLDGSSFLKRAADRGRALSDMSHIYQWDDSGLSWSENDVISVVLDANETSHPRVGETLRADTSGHRRPERAP